MDLNSEIQKCLKIAEDARKQDPPVDHRPEFCDVFLIDWGLPDDTEKELTKQLDERGLRTERCKYIRIRSAADAEQVSKELSGSKQPPVYPPLAVHLCPMCDAEKAALFADHAFDLVPAGMRQQVYGVISEKHPVDPSLSRKLRKTLHRLQAEAETEQIFHVLAVGDEPKAANRTIIAATVFFADSCYHEAQKELAHAQSTFAKKYENLTLFQPCYAQQEAELSYYYAWITATAEDFYRVTALRTLYVSYWNREPADVAQMTATVRRILEEACAEHLKIADLESVCAEATGLLRSNMDRLPKTVGENSGVNSWMPGRQAVDADTAINQKQLIQYVAMNSPFRQFPEAISTDIGSLLVNRMLQESGCVDEKTMALLYQTLSAAAQRQDPKAERNATVESLMEIFRHNATAVIADASLKWFTENRTYIEANRKSAVNDLLTRIRSQLGEREVLYPELYQNSLRELPETLRRFFADPEITGKYLDTFRERWNADGWQNAVDLLCKNFHVLLQGGTVSAGDGGAFIRAAGLPGSRFGDAEILSLDYHLTSRFLPLYPIENLGERPDEKRKTIPISAGENTVEDQSQKKSGGASN